MSELLELVLDLVVGGGGVAGGQARKQRQRRRGSRDEQADSGYWRHCDRRIGNCGWKVTSD